MLCIQSKAVSTDQYSNKTEAFRRNLFGDVFFISKSLLGIVRQKKLKKLQILTRKPRIHIRILIYRAWSILKGGKQDFTRSMFPVFSSKV